MLNPVTNKIIAEGTGDPLTKVRRWTNEFLPPDPKATRQSGYTRKLTANEAWFVSLSGRIVENTRMTFDTVRKLMDTTIRPWLLENGLVPEIPKVCHPRGVDRMIWYGFYLNFTNTLARWEDVGIKVTGIRTVIGSQSGVDEIGREYEYETIKNFKYQLKPVGKWAGIAPYSMLQIPVGNLAYQFIGVIWGTDVQEKWWKKFNQLHME